MSNLVHPQSKVLDQPAFQASEITVDAPQLPVEHGTMGLNTPLAVSTLPRIEVLGSPRPLSIQPEDSVLGHQYRPTETNSA